MIDTPIQITSVNMRRRNPLFTAFLKATSADIVLVQEPWFGRINTLRSDSDPLGTAVHGPVKNDKWEVFLPKHSGSDICKVACYVRRSLAMSPDVTIVPMPDDDIATLSSQVLEVSISGNVFRLVNIYHHCPKKGHGLSHLFTHPLDPSLPTLVVGDFNTHSSTWSSPGATVSSWATPLEEWFEDSDLTLANPAGLATRKGNPKHNERDSVLDLVLINDTAIATGRFSPITISFEDSIGSDHAALHIYWSPPLPPAMYSPQILPGFKLDDTLADTWKKEFAKLPTPSITSLPSLIAVADALDADIYSVSGSLFKRRTTPDYRGLRWWNLHCEAALTAVTSSQGTSRAPAIKALRQTIVEAKRAWSNDALAKAASDVLCLWKATQWRHGR